MNQYQDQDQDIEESKNIIKKQLGITDQESIDLLSKYNGDIIEAISNYIEPNLIKDNNHYNTTYSNTNQSIDKITKLREIVSDKEKVFQNIKDANKNN